MLKKNSFFSNLAEFLFFLRKYFKLKVYNPFSKFEIFKDFLAGFFYKKRGKYARPFLHFFIITLSFLVIAIGPVILEKEDSHQRLKLINILSSLKFKDMSFYTVQAEEVKKYRGGEIIVHFVQEGEDLDLISKRYNLKINTLLWENNLRLNAKVKIGQEIRILPLDGVRHRVVKGETIYTIGKKYGLEEAQIQMIIDYPFNNFLNEENFALVIGQYLMVPDGFKKDFVDPAGQPTFTQVLTPDAGSVTATGEFVWPATGYISQGYKFYHKAIDIASRSGGNILAVDGGIIIVAGWPDNSGYGNRVIVDHGNGLLTLYAHLNAISVQKGQRVNKGDLLGLMGSTGRSTGTHLHFEIRKDGVLLDPFSYLK